MPEKAVPSGLTLFNVQGFRHLASASLNFSPYLNVIYGDNAAGKSSLLEAIYFLARAKSFLTPRLQRVITSGGKEIVVSGRVQTASGRHQLGVSFTEGKTRVRLNGEDVRSLSEFAGLIPVQVLNTEAQRLLTEGPTERRSFLNWGVFHVEPAYREVWRRYQRGLRQRNAALRLGNELVAKAWETELSQAGEAVTAVRTQFLDTLMAEWATLLNEWMPNLTFDWRYRTGWLQGESLSDALQRGRGVELKQGFTLYGPHRADLVLVVDDQPVSQRLSRGQQKIVVIALRLALLTLWRHHSASRPILLLDDLAAELDAHHRGLVMDLVRGMDVQTFITTIEAERVPVSDQAQWFHVEQGRISADERDQRGSA